MGPCMNATPIPPNDTATKRAERFDKQVQTNKEAITEAVDVIRMATQKLEEAARKLEQTEAPLQDLER